MHEYDGDPATGFMFGLYRYIDKRGHVTVVQPMWDDEHKVPFLYWSEDERKRLLLQFELRDLYREMAVKFAESLERIGCGQWHENDPVKVKECSVCQARKFLHAERYKNTSKENHDSDRTE
jgi:hypothetical protein